MQDWLTPILYSIITVSLVINAFTLRLNGLKVNYFTKYVIYNIWMEFGQECLILFDLLNSTLGDPSPLFSWFIALLRIGSAELGFLFSTMFLLVGLSVISGSLNSKLSVPTRFVIGFGISYSLLSLPYGNYQPIASNLVRSIYYISMWSVRVIVGIILAYQVSTMSDKDENPNRVSLLMLRLIVTYAITDYISTIPMILLDMGFQQPIFWILTYLHFVVKAIAHYLVILYHIKITAIVAVPDPTEETSLLQPSESQAYASMRDFANNSGLFGGFEDDLEQNLFDNFLQNDHQDNMNNSNAPTEFPLFKV